MEQVRLAFISSNNFTVNIKSLDCDDDPSKWGRIINSLKVYSFNDLKVTIHKMNIKEIIIAIPNLNFNSRKLFQQKLKDF